MATVISLEAYKIRKMRERAVVMTGNKRILVVDHEQGKVTGAIKIGDAQNAENYPIHED